MTAKMTTKWIADGRWDTGNGAIIHRSRSGHFPRTARYEFRSYCGREKDKTWYEIDGDPSQRQFATAAKAEQAAAQLRAQPTDSLMAEFRRRGISNV